MEKTSPLSRNCVFISEIPDNTEITPIYPPERYAEILNTSNERLKKEKYFVWRLLEYALMKCRGVNINDAEIKKGESGRWGAEGFDFSLSHSAGVAAVAISDTSVGVDIEEMCTPKSENFAKRILSDGEYQEFLSVQTESREEYLIKKWTAKEAVFKSRNGETFIPKKTETHSDTVKTDTVVIKDKKYVFSVFAINEEEINVEIVNLKL